MKTPAARGIAALQQLFESKPSETSLIKNPVKTTYFAGK
jgi:hypothetical protein